MTNVPKPHEQTEPAGGAQVTQSPDDGFARILRSGPVGVLVIIAALLIGNFPLPGTAGGIVLLWAHLSHTPWGELGFVRPKNWVFTVAGGIAFGVAFKVFMKAVVMPLFGADPINHAYHYLAGNTAALPGAIVLMIVGAGFGEETVYRGFMFERLRRMLGASVWAKTATVLITSAVFALMHYPTQGWAGVEQAAITGTVFGTIFVISGRIWLPMVLHAAFDLAALAIIYLDMESAVAHLVFK